MPASPTATIVNAQWDFDYGDFFSSTPGFKLGRKGGKPMLSVEHTFDSSGTTTVACRVQDDMGGERTAVWEVTVS